MLTASAIDLTAGNARTNLVESIMGSLFGDLNLNKTVSFADFALLQGNLGMSGGGWAGDGARASHTGPGGLGGPLTLGCRRWAR